MNLFAYKTLSLILIAFALAATESRTVASVVDASFVVQIIKKDVAQLVTGLNMHDAAKTTTFDAAGIVSMECGQSFNCRHRC